MYHSIVWWYFGAQGSATSVKVLTKAHWLDCSDFRLDIGFRIRPQKAPTQAGLLATFNFGFKAGALFVLLSQRHIHLVHESGAEGARSFVWTSPPLDLQSNAWHRLELIPISIRSQGSNGDLEAERMRVS